ncbi:MAG: Hsp70 family protein [Candidatus Altarchaeaceae archaeon]
MKSILSVKDLSKIEIMEILDLAKNLKKNKNLYANALSGKIFLLFFEKPSTRTRVSYESAIYQLNGKVIFLGKDDSQLSRGEGIEDTGKILNKYVDCIIARVYDHNSLIKLKENVDIPIINALSDLEHPTQILSDVFTMYEEKNFKDFNFTLCYTGDCNNVCNSLILASEILDFKLNVATSKKFMKIYEKNFEKINLKINELKNVKFYGDPKEAVKDADFVYTDVWISMGEKEDIEKIILVGGPTRMPIIQKFIEEYLGKKPEGGVDPMECVAMGAAIQGAVLAGEVRDILLLDVTPLTLSVETLGGIATPMIPANTTIPTRKTSIFTTAADFQTAVTIHIVQGERPLAKDNVSLGMFHLTGIPPAPRGVPQIEVTFDIDANGILNVKAKDLATGKEAGITITASTKLSKEEIERMRREAEQYAEQDRKAKEKIELKNDSESLIYQTEKVLKDFGDKISSENKKKIEDAKNELKDALSKDEINLIKQKFENLRNILQEVGTAIYQQASQQYSQQQTEQKTQEEKKDKKDAYDTDFKVEK